jgi:hypothetical protein
VDEHNHALAALRYLISRLDARRMAKMAKRMPAGDGVGDDDGQAMRLQAMGRAASRTTGEDMPGDGGG